MNKARLVTTAVLVATAFSLLPVLATPAFAAESITCPTSTVNVPSTGTTFVCTATWSSGTGSTQGASVGCEATYVCTGWTMSITPTTFGTGCSTGCSQSFTVSITPPSPVGQCATYSDCTTEIYISTTGGGFGIVAASATVGVTTPEFGLGVVSVIAVGLFAVVGLRRRQIRAAPAATFG